MLMILRIIDHKTNKINSQIEKIKRKKKDTKWIYRERKKDIKIKLGMI